MGDVGQSAAGRSSEPPQLVEGDLLVQAVAFHQHALGLLDQHPGGQRDLDIQWRSYSLLLRDGTQGLQDQTVAIRTASHRAVRVMEALRRHDPAAVPRFYETLLPRTFAAVNAGGPPFGGWKVPCWPPGWPRLCGGRRRCGLG
jgi:hypothetical protein